MPYTIDFAPEPEKKNQEKVQKSSSDSPSLFERLLTLVITWQYFRYTGKAIAAGHKLPRGWLSIKNKLLPRKVRELLDDTPKPKTSSYKVVDIATNKPISIPQ
jgi:hypothetical protein